MIDVSVIIPCYNAENTISRAINSALHQNCICEVIVIDDYSTDASVEVVSALVKCHENIILIKNSFNMGPGFCRNIAIANARGEFVAFLDSDDVWLDGKLSQQISYMRDFDLNFTFHDYYEICVGSTGNEFGFYNSSPDFAKLPMFYYTRGYGLCLTSMVRRESIMLAKFSEDRSILAEDYEFFLNLIASGCEGVKFPGAFGVYFINKHSRSSNKIRQAISVLRVNMRLAHSQAFIKLFYFAVYVVFQFFVRAFNFKKRLDYYEFFSLNEIISKNDSNNC